MTRNKYIPETKMGNCKIALLFFLLMFPFMMVAQDEAAPLIEKLPQAKGNEKVDILNEISVVYRKSDRYGALDYARQAYSVASRINYLPGKALAKKNEGICWFFVGNNDSATICYTESLDIFTLLKDQKGMSACYNNLGLIAQETGKYDEALRLYELSINIDTSLGDISGATTTKRNVVDINIYKGNLKLALSLSDEILIECKNQSDKEGVMRALINRAAIYDNLKQFNDAISDQKEAIAIAKDLKDSYAEAMALSNYGLVTWHKGNDDDALKILNNVLEISSDANQGYEILNTLWILSEIYASKKEYSRSNEKFIELLKRYEEMDNKRQVAKVLTSLGRNLMETNEIDKAFGYLYKSLEITTELDAPFEKLENYRNLAHANAVLHKFKLADSLQDLYAQTYSSLYNADSIVAFRDSEVSKVNAHFAKTSVLSDWITAFASLIVMILLSVIAYRK